MKQQHLQRKLVRGDRNTSLDLLNMALEVTLPQTRLRKRNSPIPLLLRKLKHSPSMFLCKQAIRPRSVELGICIKNNNEIQSSNMN